MALVFHNFSHNSVMPADFSSHWDFLADRFFSSRYMITSLGYGTYFFFASLMILMGVWSFFCVPETRGLSLEEMDRLFGILERQGGDAKRKNEELEMEKADGLAVERVENTGMRKF